MSTVVQSAHAAGYKYIDVYVFPNTNLDAASSMQQLMNTMLSEGVLTNNMIWMDIEGTQYWSSSCSTNQQWLATAINTIQGMYKGCGLSSCVGKSKKDKKINYIQFA